MAFCLQAVASLGEAARPDSPLYDHDQTVTIFFLAPLLVALLAGPLLHEWVGWHRMMAILAGFLGVLLVMHPGFGTLHWAMLISLVATFGYALYNLSTRYLAAFDPPEVTQTYTPLAGLGHWLLILAHRHAPASALAPYIYLGLIWMSAAGFLVFGQVPTVWTLSGAGVVILSGLYLFARERKVLGAKVAGPASDIATQ